MLIRFKIPVIINSKYVNQLFNRNVYQIVLKMENLLHLMKIVSCEEV